MDNLRTGFADLPWADLVTLRQRYPGDAMMQSLLAPLEHRAYARELSKIDPFQAAAMVGLIPAYQGAKALGITPRDNTSTPASLDELFAGFQGLIEGLR
jgi:hypothetical protein